MRKGRLDLRGVRSQTIPGLGRGIQHTSLYEKQRSFMFSARINLPFLNSIVNSLIPSLPEYIDVFTYSVIQASVPSKDREVKKKRFYNETWTVPAGDDWDHKWDCTILMSELGFEYDILRYWFEYVRVAESLQDAKGSIKVELNRMDGNSVNKVFDLVGVYPLNIPEISDLNHDEKLGMIKLKCNFAFDKVNYGVLDNIFDLLGTII